MIPGLIINNSLRSLYNLLLKKTKAAFKGDAPHFIKCCKVPENGFQIDAHFKALRANQVKAIIIANERVRSMNLKTRLNF